MAAALVAFLPPLGHAFTTSVLISTSNFIELRATGGGDGSYSEENNLASDGGKVQDFGEEDLQVAGVMLEDLSWRVEKLRLEEENIRRFLKAKARFLPYEECRKWVHAFNRWSTEQEWKDWIEMGEKRNSYIPSRPDEYYTDTGDWISWDHFLGVDAEGIAEAQEND